MKAGPAHRATIRAAARQDLPALHDIAVRSKAHWGYDAEFMARAAEDLEFRPEKFQPGFLVFVMESAGRYWGFYGLIPLSATAIELHDLFVDPEEIGTGLGKRLWRHAVETAKALGYSRMELTSDPNAEGFYRKMGAVAIGMVGSPVMKGRRLPRMEFGLD